MLLQQVSDSESYTHHAVSCSCLGGLGEACLVLKGLHDSKTDVQIFVRVMAKHTLVSSEARAAFRRLTYSKSWLEM